MSKLCNASRVTIITIVVGVLVLAMTGIAFAEGITVPGTSIQVPDILPPGVQDVVENITGAIPEVPLPGTEVVEGAENNVSGVVDGLPVDGLPIPGLPGLPTPQGLPGLDSVPVVGRLPGNLQSGAQSLNGLNASSLPSPDALASLPLAGILLDILNPANLPGLDDLPLLSAILPIIDSLLDQLAGIPILKPIIEILEKLLVILRPVSPTPTPVAGTPQPTPSTAAPIAVAAVESPAGNFFDHLPYTGADFMGVLFFVLCLLASAVMVHKFETTVKKTAFKKNRI